MAENASGWVAAIAACVAAVGTILVAIVAVWQDKIRGWLLGPKLTIRLPGDQGTLVRRNNARWVWYYHVVIKNERPKSPARNCRVTVRRIERCGPDGNFRQLGVPSALQYHWAHPSVTPPTPTVVQDRALDLAFVDQGSDSLMPPFYSYPNNFDGFVKAGECLRYYLDIEADNFASSKPKVIQVAWNGNWSDHKDEMAANVAITAPGTE